MPLGVEDGPSSPGTSDVVSPNGRTIGVGFDVVESLLEQKVKFGVGRSSVGVGSWCVEGGYHVLVGDDGGVLSDYSSSAKEVLSV